MQALLLIFGLGFAAPYLTLDCPVAGSVPGCSACCPYGFRWTGQGSSCESTRSYGGGNHLTCDVCGGCPTGRYFPKVEVRLHQNKRGAASLSAAVTRSNAGADTEAVLHDGMPGWVDLPGSSFTRFPAALAGRRATVPSFSTESGSVISFPCTDDYHIGYAACEAFFVLYRCRACPFPDGNGIGAELLRTGWERSSCPGPLFQLAKGGAHHPTAVYRKRVLVGEEEKVRVSGELRFSWWGVTPLTGPPCSSTPGCLPPDGCAAKPTGAAAAAAPAFSGPSQRMCDVCIADEAALLPAVLPAVGETPAPGTPPVDRYCEAGAERSGNEWISRFTLAGVDHRSKEDGGYSDHTGLTAVLVAGGAYTARVEFADTLGFSFPRSVGFWMDFDGDGSFDGPGETLFSSEAATSPVAIPFTVPFPDAPYVTRARVALAFENTPSPCGFTPFGEVEDYSVEVFIS